MNFSFNVYIPLNAMVGSSLGIQLKGQNSQAHGNVGTNDYNTITSDHWHNIEQSDLGKTIRISIPVLKGDKYRTFDTALADTDSVTVRQGSDTPEFVYSKLKLEIGSTDTPWIPSSSEVTAEDYPSYIGTYTDNNSNEQSTDPEKYTWKKIE